MATYQARQRDPLLDSNTQAVLERRGKELLGVGLLFAACLMGLILWSYVPEDPSWLSATDEPVRNFLGRFGASIASPLIVIAGIGAWGTVALLATWGLRFVLHKGEERAVTRAIFAPIAIALVSVYASTHVPFDGWTHSFGLGGLFGDTVLGAVLGVVPIKATIGLKVMALFMAAGALVMSAFVLGFTYPELSRIARFMLVGIIMAYAHLLRFIGHAFGFAAEGRRSMREKRLERKEARAMAADSAAAYARMSEPPVSQPAAQPMVRRAETPMEDPAEYQSEQGETLIDEGVPAPEPKPSLLSRMPSLLRRAPEPVEEPEPQLATPEDFGDPAVKAMIADVIKKRVQQKPVLRAEGTRVADVVRERHPRGPQPMILNTQPAPVVEQPQDYAPEMTEDLGQPASQDLSEMLESQDLPPLTATPEISTYEAPEVPFHEPKKVVRHAPRKTVQPSKQAREEAQPALQFEEKETEYTTPPLNLLTNPVEVERHHLADEALEENARMLESVLDDYGVKGEIISVRPGPVVTMYELEPAPGLKASRVIGLADDIARSMSALSARVSTVPGRSVIGIELPNAAREKVVLREILSARDFGDSNMRLPLALGKDIGGDSVVGA